MSTELVPWGDAPHPTLTASCEGWIARLAALHDALSVCPLDVAARSELAMLLERLEQHEEAVFHWKTVLRYDVNNLAAREGMARCLPQAGRPLLSHG